MACKILADVAEDMRNYHKERPSTEGPKELWDLVPHSILLQHGRARRMLQEAGWRMFYNHVQKQYELIRLVTEDKTPDE